MSRYTGSIFKKSRKLGFSLLENNKEFTKWKKRTTPPGQHGNQIRRKKVSLFGEQLKEKQKIIFLYGIKDKQLKNFFKKCKKLSGNIGLNLLILLESRLDNLVFRMGFAPTRRAARQLVTHGHICVNNKKHDIASEIISINDVITIKEKSKQNVLKNFDNEFTPLEFIELNKEKLSAKYIRHPERQELNSEINEMYVVEWFKKLV